MTINDKLKIEYLNNTVWCRLGPSVIHGVGVIALRDIPKGTKLTDYTFMDYVEHKEPQMFKLEEINFQFLNSSVRELILDRIVHTKDNPLIFVSPNSDQILRAFINHSNNPNSDGEYALRNIAQGEEITEDYVGMLSGKIHNISMQKMKDIIK